MSDSNVKKYDVVVLGCGEGGGADTAVGAICRGRRRSRLFASVKAVSRPAEVHA